MTQVLGVDGFRGGWVGALVYDRTQSVTWRVLAGAAEVVALDARATAVDIPMGLADSGTRRCDREARRLLPGPPTDR